jgi:cell division inhibitor SulA
MNTPSCLSKVFKKQPCEATIVSETAKVELSAMKTEKLLLPVLKT